MCSILLIISKMQIRTIMRSYHTIRIAIIKMARDKGVEVESITNSLKYNKSWLHNEDFIKS